MNDKQMLDMLRNEFEKSSESAQIPLRLQKESMVAMLKNENKNEDNKTDFSVKTGTNKTIIALRKYGAVAAVFAFILVGAMSMMTRTMLSTKVVEMDEGDMYYSDHKGAEPVKMAQSYEELRDYAKVIKNEKKAEQPGMIVQPSEPQGVSIPNIGGEETPTVNIDKNVDELYKGYQSVASVEKVGNESSGNVENPYPVNNTTSGSDVIPVQSDNDADIARIYGKYLYILATSKNDKTGNLTEQIKIVKTVSSEGMEEVSTITLSDDVAEGSFEDCVEIRVKDNILIAILNRKDSDSEVRTTAIYYDLSNPESPKKIREHTQDGKYLFSSISRNSFSLVTDKQVGETESTIVPSFTVGEETTNLSTEEIFISVKDPEASFVFITVTDMSDLNKQVGRLAILGSGKQLYCFERAIAVARVFVSVEENGEKTSRNLTEICRFNINGSSISFAGTYVVDGSLIGGVSVNGENDHMAVVTSVSDSNNLYVFDMNMEFVSGLKHIFKGKKVDTVRFIGHDCCLTSGEETMIIKLESPKFPKNAGTVPSELFTGNLYEISESRLLGIKTDSSGNTVLRLIDASNPQNLSGVSEYVIDSSYKVLSASDSRNVMIAPDKGIIGVFVLASDTETGVKYPAYMIFKVSKGEIAFAGVCRHDDAYVSDTAVSAIYNNGVIYTVSGEKVAAFSADDFSEISSCEIR